jgi:CRP-like cAMP-binding protein
LTSAFIQFPEAAKGLPESLKSALRPHAVMIRAKAGRTLVAPDSRTTHVNLVAEGRVQVAVLSSTGQEVILRDLGAGDLFGELASIDEQPRSASIVALDDCRLLSIPGPVFREAAFATPDSARWLAERLTAQIRDLTMKVFELGVLRVPSRLHCELLRMAGAPGENLGPMVIDPLPTHEELALRIGTHREAVTRELGYLSKRRIIERDRKRLTVTDPAALANLVRQAAGQIGAGAGPREPRR